MILAAALRQAGEHETAATAAMVRRAAAYIAHHGPLTGQERWEENGGASPFTLASEIVALVAAAQYLDGLEREYALALADSWNERIEEWTYARDTPLARRCGVDGYYVRIAPEPTAGGTLGQVLVHNRGGLVVRAHEMVGLEFAYLARLGLRDAADPRIRNTARVVDMLIRVETPAGPGFYRYNGDGYGEHTDGSPFDGQGIGRLWPLLSGERGHLSLLQGEDPLPYLRAMTAMTGTCGLMPEQVWDRDAPPARGLAPGQPTGSAMPLVWAHAEFLKLLVARAKGAPVELLDVVRERYGERSPTATASYWRAEVPFATLAADRALVIEDRHPFVLHLGLDGWDAPHDRAAQHLGLGMFGVRLDRDDLGTAGELRFTRFYPSSGLWEGRDHVIALALPDGRSRKRRSTAGA